MSWSKNVFSREFLIYLVVGGLTALVYFGLIALSIEVLHLDYRVGVTVAYVFAVSFHFLSNRTFTFQAQGSKLVHQSIRYLGVLVVNYLITIGVVSFFVDRLGASPYVGAALSIAVTVGVGYFASKFWVFRNRESLRD